MNEERPASAGRFRGGLRFRLFLLILLALVPASLLAILSGLDRRRDDREQALVELERVARLAAYEQRHLFEHGQVLLSVLAKAPVLQEGEPAAVNAFLADVRAQNTRYVNLGTADSNGVVLASAVPLPRAVTVAGRAWFQRAQTQRLFAVGDYQIGLISGRPVVVMAQPLGNDRPAGPALLFAALDLKWTERFLADTGLPEDSSLALFDQEGTLLAHYPALGVPGSQTHLFTAGVLELIRSGRRRAEMPGLDGQGQCVALAPVQVPGDEGVVGYLLLGRSRASVFAQADADLHRNLLLLVAAAALALIVADVIGRRLVLRRVWSMTDAVNHYSSGELTPRCPEGGDEIGRLGHAFNDMAASLLSERTRRDQATAALRESEERHRRIVETSEEGIWLLGADHRTTFVNRRLAALLGWAEKEMLGRPFEDFLAPAVPDRPGVAPQRPRSGRAEQQEVRLATRNGRVVWALVASSPLYDQQGRFAGKLAMVTDIRAQKEAEAELRASQDRLRALTGRLHDLIEQERTSIAQRIHDELGQGLTGLKMDVSWLHRRSPEGEVGGRLVEMQQQLDDLIQRVRDISAELRPGVLDDLGLVAALDWLARDFIRRSGVDCSCRANGDVERLDQDMALVLYRVTQEALANVARHAGARKVEIDLSEVGGRVMLRIEDDGRGIRPEEVASRSALGLIGVRERVAGCGGVISIVGEPGHGTTILITVPLQRGPPGEKA